MPYIVYGNTTRKREVNPKRKHKYTYPRGLNLAPDSKLHGDLVARILELADTSHTEMTKRHPTWRKIDDVLTAYIKLDDYETAVKAKDSRKPVSIVLPNSYTILDAILTYMTAAFLQEPIFQYEGFDSKDYKGAILMQSVIAHHCRKAKIPLALHTMFRDGFAYGIGNVIPSWEVKYGMRTRTGASIAQIGTTVTTGTPQKMRERALLYEGNVLYNINPYLNLPDPTVGPERIQNGQFHGWLESTNLLNLLAMESSGEHGMFNCKYLDELPTLTSSYMTDGAHNPNSDSSRGNPAGSRSNSVVTTVDVLPMYVKLIPSAWGLGNSDVPETWLFRVAADSLLIQAEPLDLDHGMMPIAAAAPNYDGRSICPVSNLEVMYGLQEVGDWLFNSHITNVRKSINNMLIVDPNLLNLNDLRDPGPGKLIRLRRPAWGRGVEGSYAQLKVDDITRGNIADASIVQQAMHLAGGTDPSMMGALRQGGPERLTKGEFQGTRSSAMQRLERVARLVGIQAMQDIGYMLAVHTQQFMSEETSVKLIGDLTAELENELGGKTQGQYAKAGPFDLLVDFDLITKDGSIPGGSFSDAWPDLFKTIATTPELSQELSTVNIFMYMAREMGAKNIQQFKKNLGQITGGAQPMGDEQVRNQAQRGNIVPIKELMA